MADDNQVNEAEVKEARDLGWLPKEEYKGNAEKWVDHSTFLEKGRHILPIVTENNKRLQRDLDRVAIENRTLHENLKATQAAVAALEATQEEDVKAQVEDARKRIRTELEQASRDGDHGKVADLTVELTSLAKPADGETPEQKRQREENERRVTEVRPDPALARWYDENRDFTSDRRKVRLATTIAMELREGGERSVGPEFMDKVRDEVEKTLNPGQVRDGGRTKVNAGNGGSRNSGGGGGNDGGKTYSDLPAEAKAACDKMQARLVGPNRAHKDIASWRKSYVTQYFKDA